MDNLKAGLFKVKSPCPIDAGTRQKINEHLESTSEYRFHIYHDEKDSLSEVGCIITLQWTQEQLDNCIAEIKDKQAAKGKE